MSEEITYNRNADKADLYAELMPQMQSILSGETDIIANMANFSAVIKEAFNHLWVGFYIVRDGELVLGPFQGPLACTRIRRGRGVCGTAWNDACSLVVPDVDLFPGHIACSSASRSEIVVPIIANGTVCAVLDIDSSSVNTFDETDRLWLERMVLLLKM